MKKIGFLNLESIAAEKHRYDFQIKTDVQKKETLLRFGNLKINKTTKTFGLKCFEKAGELQGIKNKKFFKLSFSILIYADSSNYYLTHFQIENPFIILNIRRIYNLIKYHVAFYNTLRKTYIEITPKNIFAIIKYNQDNLNSEEDLELFKNIDSEKIITPYMASYINQYL